MSSVSPTSSTSSTSLDPATFNIDSPRTVHTDAALLDALRTFAALHPGRPFSKARFDAWEHRPCSAATIVKRFGAWRSALLKIGVKGSRCFNYNPAELIANLEDIWRRLGRAPGCTAVRRHGPIPFVPYYKHWGSVREACRRLAAYHRGAITRDELLRRVPPGSSRRCRPPMPPRLRWKILDRDAHRCTACGRGSRRARGAPGRPVVLHVDHIIPVSKGGTNDETNLRTLCSTCNLGRGVGP